MVKCRLLVMATRSCVFVATENHVVNEASGVPKWMTRPHFAKSATPAHTVN